MKTRELIERLKAVDPSGNIEVTVGGNDIYFLTKKPCYWNGPVSLIKRDRAREIQKWYSIAGFNITGSGNHVSIITMSTRDGIINDPEVHIEYLNVSEEYIREIEEWRAKCRAKYLKIQSRSMIEKIFDRLTSSVIFLRIRSVWLRLKTRLRITHF